MRRLANILSFAAVGALLSGCMVSRVTTITAPNQGQNASSSGSTSGGTTSGNSSGTGQTVTGATVTVAWNAGAVNPTGYAIQQSTDGVNFTTAGTVSGSTTSTTVSGLAYSTHYFFRIYSYNSTGNSPTTAVVSATTPSKQ